MKETTQAKVASLRNLGVSYQDIADVLDMTLKRVHAAAWRVDNAEKRRASNKAYGALRYGTPEYREHNREYAYKRYHSDPDFRRRRIDAVLRYKARKAEEGDGAGA